MMKRIDTISYQNKLRSVSPTGKCGFAAVLFVLSYISHPFLQLLIGAVMLLWTVAYAKVPLRDYGILIGTPCLFYAVSLPPIILELHTANGVLVASSAATSFPDIPLLTIGHQTVLLSGTGMAKAVELFTRIIGCLSCLTFVMLTIPMSELFQVMSKLRMPSLVLELMLIMYRFLFLLTDTAEQMVTAQKARGGQSGFRGRLRDTAMLIVRLFGKTMHRYRDLSYGLTARGFTYEIRLAPYQPKPWPLRYRWEGLLTASVLILIEIWIRWRG